MDNLRYFWRTPDSYEIVLQIRNSCDVFYFGSQPFEDDLTDFCFCYISFGRWWWWSDYSQKFPFCLPTLVSQTTQPLRWPYNHLFKRRAVNLRSCQCAITNFQLFTPCYFSRWELVSDNSQQTVFSSPSLCHWGPVLSCQCPITNFQLFTTWYFYFWRWPVVLFPGEGV